MRWRGRRSGPGRSGWPMGKRRRRSLRHRARRRQCATRGIFHAARILAYVEMPDRALRLLQESVDHGFLLLPRVHARPLARFGARRPDSRMCSAASRKGTGGDHGVLPGGGYGVPGLGGWE